MHPASRLCFSRRFCCFFNRFAHCPLPVVVDHSLSFSLFQVVPSLEEHPAASLFIHVSKYFRRTSAYLQKHCFVRAGKTLFGRFLGQLLGRIAQTRISRNNSSIIRIYILCNYIFICIFHSGFSQCAFKVHRLYCEIFVVVFLATAFFDSERN